MPRPRDARALGRPAANNRSPHTGSPRRGDIIIDRICTPLEHYVLRRYGPPDFLVTRDDGSLVQDMSYPWIERIALNYAARDAVRVYLCTRCGPSAEYTLLTASSRWATDASPASEPGTGGPWEEDEM